MADDTILISTEGRVATITINRPDKLNALNEPTRAAIVAALNRLEDDPEVRVVVLTGSGEKAFIAGADIGEFEGRAPVAQYRVMNSPATNAFEAADRFPKPIIAAINGFCLGGGCELAMACDIRIASDKAKLGQPEINLGLLPGGGGTQRLPRLVGLGTAFKLLYTGDMIGADEALRLGLVDEVIPAADLMTRVKALAGAIATKSPVALRYIKDAVRASVRAPMDEGLQLERTLFGLVFASEDKAEGVEAFLQKRKPDFKGA
ncbi:MAG: enoyl-CoA hydratase-related protein [Gemmatimonadota bacterium]|nr:enoyl-CoA hydratase-related protein [Gemmatimonadota bacterium]MDH4351294.1 enoyl-CoA hydratase-related protein [Gemmatimonadota bacterium]MDH5197417.1 enoyl-CoA hydratase-related protein [Gemmatimonadota bacterium]